MTTPDIIVATLNELIETCRDGEYGFTDCAKHVTSIALKNIFVQRAADCRQAAQELEQKVIEYGGRPAQGGTSAGALHRGWVAVRGSLFGLSDPALLDECERGEDVALERYRAAIKDDQLPDALRKLVEKQIHGTQQTRDQIKALREHFGVLA